MDAATHLRHARVAGERIAEVADGADLKAPVPSCPDYDLGSLVVHTGAFCRFARSAVEQGRMPDLDFSDIGDDPLAWHRQEHGRLVDVLEATDPGATGWSWGSDQRPAFWFRRAAQELGVHRWDVESSAGDPQPIDAALAADGIDELLAEFGVSHEGWKATVTGAAVHYASPGATLHLHATDVDEGGEWLVHCHADRFEVAHEHRKGDVAARGTASDLLLFLWGRVPKDALEVFGDSSLLDRWSERVNV